jgi:hypothetical protein
VSKLPWLELLRDSFNHPRAKKARLFKWKDEEGNEHKPEEMLFPELINPNAGNPKFWKSIIQDGLEEYIRDEHRNKAIIDSDEMTRTFRMDLPEDKDLVEALWHNTIVYVDKGDNKLVSVELVGMSDGFRKEAKLPKADDVVFIKTVSPGVLAISYDDNSVELRNMNLDTICCIDYGDPMNAKWKGDKGLKELLDDENAASEIYMYLAPDDINALLVFSAEDSIISYKLKKTPEGKFEIVELLSEPKLPETEVEENAEKDAEKPT